MARHHQGIHIRTFDTVTSAPPIQLRSRMGWVRGAGLSNVRLTAHRTAIPAARSSREQSNRVILTLTDDFETRQPCDLKSCRASLTAINQPRHHLAELSLITLLPRTAWQLICFAIHRAGQPFSQGLEVGCSATDSVAQTLGERSKTRRRAQSGIGRYGAMLNLLDQQQRYIIALQGEALLENAASTACG